MLDSRHRHAGLTKATATPSARDAACAIPAERAGRATEEMAGLLRTLERDNVRRLSVRLLIDLLALEADRSRAAELVCDAAVLGEELLLAGDYDGAREVIRALARHVANPRSPAGDAARVALEGLVTTLPVRPARACMPAVRRTAGSRRGRSVA